MVPIADELRFARNYLQIQDIRFPDRFRMELLIPPDVGRGFMLKFLLQPMVENCFTHGLRDKRVNVQIRISGQREDGGIYLSIYDNGTGMSAQVCAGWNRRLQDGDSRDKTDNIGLINVNARIRSFYGAPYGVSVESSPGTFTRITLHLKALERRENLLEGGHGTDRPKPRIYKENTMRVLVADDEFYARKAILKILEDLDVEVAAGLETGREVLSFLEQDARVDAALLDIRMPELSGLEVAAHIHRFYPQIGVILITGYADFPYAQQAIQYGVKDYITKPIRRETIQLSLTKLLAAQERKAASVHSYSGGEQALECSAEQLSIKELSRNENFQQLFMKSTLKYVDDLEYRVLLFQTDPEAAPEQRAQIRSWLQLDAGTTQTAGILFQKHTGIRAARLFQKFRNQPLQSFELRQAHPAEAAGAWGAFGQRRHQPPASGYGRAEHSLQRGCVCH